MATTSKRTIKILSWLSAGHRFTTTEIRDRLAKDGEHVHIRTIQRDLKTLEESGTPLTKTADGEHIRYGLNKKHAVVPVGLHTPTTPLLSVYLLKAALPQFQALEVTDDLTALLDRVDKAHPGEVFSTDLIASITLGEYQGATQISSDDLDTIITAIVNKQWLRITYKRTDNTFEIYPYRLIPYLGRLYIAAWNRKHRQFITLAADKVRKADTAPRIKEAAPAFSINDFMSNRFGIWDSPTVETIIIRASKDIYHEIAPRRWHPTQQLTDLADGGIEIRLRTGISYELISWILHWSPHLTVVKPRSLKEEVKKRLTEALKNYGDT